MRRLVLIVITAVFLAALLSFTVTYTVRFTEAAVLTTFGKAGPEDVKKDAGLRFKWPYPIQSVTKYDTRLRILQARSETQQTADDRQIIVEAFCTWRVTDPLKFFQRFSNAGERSVDHYRSAEESLRKSLSSALASTSKFRLSELFTPDPAGTKLGDLEGQVLATMNTGGEQAGTLANWGLEVMDVGVSRIVLPEATTTAVFDAMGQTRDKLAKELESKGASVAQTIRSTAESNARKIETFAQTLAQEIKSRGDNEAAEYIKKLDSNPQLAVFLRKMEFFKDVMSKRATFVMTASELGLVDPSALGQGGGPTEPGPARPAQPKAGETPAGQPRSEGAPR
ncbi:MAG: hypothetical protein IT436_11605 [Phycisphaerales bacterium]|nr:hypothetical protein [Phycisphaerales bacterium]